MVSEDMEFHTIKSGNRPDKSGHALGWVGNSRRRATVILFDCKYNGQ